MRDRPIIASSGAWVVVLTISLLLPVQFSHAQADSSLDELIENLGSPDPHVRENSTISILRLGPSAKASLRWATHHPVPEVASRTRELLGRLAFYLPEDSPEVKACLFGYENEDEHGRAERIERLGRLKTPDARRALTRVALDEPSLLVRWKAIAPLIVCEDQSILAEIRDLRPARDVAELVLVACAWRNIDLNKSAKFLQRAMMIGRSCPESTVEIAEQLVPLLKGMDLVEDARGAFEDGHRILKTIAFAPAAAPMDVNRLALYLIRCNENLPQAVELAGQASASDPEEPSFLSTLAEAQYRVGHTIEAIKTQQRAAELCPNDAGIESRLQQFLAAVE